MTDWRDNLIETPAQIGQLIAAASRIAVLGIKTEARADQPAFYVPRYLAKAGFTIVPVPVYYPEATQILGQPVFRSLAAIPGPIDIVQVFRRPADIPQHLEDILAKRPGAVWFQAGIRNDAVAEALAMAGIKVVQDHCLMVEHRERQVVSR